MPDQPPRQDQGGREADVLIVGGGQAGLAMAHALKDTGDDVQILEAAPRLGTSWRSRWDSLTLFTPTHYSSLPGVDLPGERDSYPTKDQVADYLEEYASVQALSVTLDTTVTAVERIGSSGYRVRTSRGDWHAAQVVLATGPFQVPVVPAAAAGLHSAVTQIHSAEYRRPSQLPDGRVLVAGGGNSGYQIAHELARAGREVHLSRRTANASIPQRVFGKDIFWWQDITGLMRVRGDSRLGRRMRSGEGTVIGVSAKDLTEAGVQIHGPVLDADGDLVRWQDAEQVTVSAVVWATGFRQEHSIVRVAEAFDDHSRLVHHRGVTPAPGLYVLGLPWLHTTGSALLGFVSRDAAYLAKQIKDFSSSSTR